MDIGPKTVTTGYYYGLPTMFLPQQLGDNQAYLDPTHRDSTLPLLTLSTHCSQDYVNLAYHPDPAS